MYLRAARIPPPMHLRDSHTPPMRTYALRAYPTPYLFISRIPTCAKRVYPAPYLRAARTPQEHPAGQGQSLNWRGFAGSLARMHTRVRARRS